jgi:hypothetical protein
MSEDLVWRVPAIPPVDLFWGAIALYPYFLEESADERGQMALEAVHDLWDKAHVHVQKIVWEAQELEREQGIRSRLKELTDPVEEDDERTAQGYFKVKYGRSYKTAKNFRDMLDRNRIRIGALRLPGGRSRSEVVRISDLDKVGEKMRAKERERKKAARAKARVSQENRSGISKKGSGINPAESA